MDNQTAAMNTLWTALQQYGHQPAVGDNADVIKFSFVNDGKTVNVQVAVHATSAV